MPRQISLFDVQPIFDRLSAGHLFLTPNQRLASRICTSYAISCKDRGQAVVKHPAVYSLSQWIERCWRRLLISAHPLAVDIKPLSANQEQAVWEQIVNDSSLGAVLMRPVATAQQAAAAYRTLVEWQQSLWGNSSAVEILRRQFSSDDDCAVMLAWIDNFEQRCAEHAWLAPVRRAERIMVAFKDGLLSTEGDITGIGFENIAPLYQSLISSAGMFSHYESRRSLGSVSVTSCDTVKQEILAAAVWAKQVLKNDETATVAIVVPDLSRQRHILQRVINEVFDPDYNAPLTEGGEPNERRNLPFNISAGYPLLDAPIITAAINALSLTFRELETTTLQAICQSPFYCLGPPDTEAVFKLTSLLFEQRELVINSIRFRELVNKVADGLTTPANNTETETQWSFAQALQQIASLSPSRVLAQARPTSDWITLIDAVLMAIGWPGRRKLDSFEYQQVNHWQQALHEFAALGFVQQPIGFQQAVKLLRGILSRQIFQPQTPDSSLQILGTLEASGLQFSHLWLVSMSEKQWPSPPSPNPLLPYSLQRDLNMPHSTADRELEYSKNLSQRFLHNADHLVISAADVIDDSPTSISDIFSRFPKKSLTELLGGPLQDLLPLVEMRRRHMESQCLEKYKAGNAPILHPSEKIRGGSSLFSSQAACPFKAFASHRLGLKAQPEPELGLSAADRGSLLHRALELLWKKIETQQNLLALDQEQQQNLCLEISQCAVNEILQRRHGHIGPRFKALEIKRIQQLLDAWLEVERERADFTVLCFEDKKSFNFDSLNLEIRIDRIDQLEDGSLLIIDYKTALCSLSSWWGDRPEEPQLPLYNMLVDSAEKKVSGIAFAQIRVDGCTIKGIGSEQSPEPSVRWQHKIKSEAGVTDWPDLQTHWQKVLTTIARDFISGKADVDPKSPPQTCLYCDLASFCRVNHREVVLA